MILSYLILSKYAYLCEVLLINSINKRNMNNGYRFFRIKETYKGTDEQGAVVKIKTEDLVMATCYTEAEKIAYALAEGKDNFGDVDIEIVRTKIQNVVFNNTFAVDTNPVCGLISYYFEESDETEVALYQVNLTYYDTDEKTGKEKTQNDTIFVPAASSYDAIDNVGDYLKKQQEHRDYAIRNIKYDKAQSVLVTPETYEHDQKSW